MMTMRTTTFIMTMRTTTSIMTMKIGLVKAIGKCQLVQGNHSGKEVPNM